MQGLFSWKGVMHVITLWGSGGESVLRFSLVALQTCYVKAWSVTRDLFWKNKISFAEEAIGNIITSSYKSTVGSVSHRIEIFAQFNHLNLLSNFLRLFVTRLKLRMIRCTALFGMFPRTCDVRHVSILFHFFINSARFRKKCFVFFSFVVRFRLVIRFYSHFFGLLVRFFPQHQVFQQKRLYSSCQAFLRDGPLEKLWGGGEFSNYRNFFSLSNSLYEFFLGQSMNIF